MFVGAHAAALGNGLYERAPDFDQYVLKIMIMTSRVFVVGVRLVMILVSLEFYESKRQGCPCQWKGVGENGWCESHGEEDFVDTKVHFALCPRSPSSLL